MNSSSGWKQAALAGLLLALLNLAKPLVVDDGIFIQVAWNILSHPLDPVGFETVFRGIREPASWFPAPPVVPYWLAGSMALGGDSEVWLKLAFMPWAFFFAAGAWLLSRRFLSRTSTPFLWTVCLSPVVVPAINLMTDIPAIALGLIALALWFKAVLQTWDGFTIAPVPDRKWACWAGVLLGLACLTKLSAVSLVPAILLMALAIGPQAFAAAAVTAVIAIAFPIAWELFYWFHNGISPVAFQIAHPPHPKSWPGVALGNLAHLGVAGLGLGLVLLWALTRSAVATWLAVLFFAGFTALLAYVEVSFAYTLAATLFTLGLILWAALKQWRTQPPSDAPSPLKFNLSIESLLLLWLALEFSCAWVISPFPAARRVILLVIILALLAWRLAERRLQADPLPTGQRHALTAAGIAAAALGLLFFTVDYTYAFDVRAAITQARVQNPATDSNPQNIWFVGNWSGAYYSRQAAFLDTLPNESVMEPGQKLVIAEDGLFIPNYKLPASAVSLINRIPSPPGPGYSLLHGYYAGNYPLHHRTTPHITLAVYDIVKPFVFETLTPGETLLWRAFDAHHPIAPGDARPFLTAVLAHQPADLPRAMQLLADSTPLCLEPALMHPDANVRAATLKQLSLTPPPPALAPRFIPLLEFLSTNDSTEPNRQAAKAALQTLH